MSSSKAAGASPHFNGENSRRGLASVSERNVHTQFSSFRKSPEKKLTGMSYNQFPPVQGSRQSPLLKAGALQTGSQSFYQAPPHSRESGNSLLGSSWSAQKQEILRDRMNSAQSSPTEFRSRESSRNSAGSREREHKPSGVAIDFISKFNDFNSEEDRGEDEAAEDNIRDYRSDIWDDLKSETDRLQTLYHKLAAKLDGGSKYSAQMLTYNSIGPRRDYVHRLQAISRVTQFLNQALRDKVTLQHVVHGGEFLLNINANGKESFSEHSYDKLFAYTFDVLSSCGATIFHELILWTTRPESRNTPSIQALLSNKGKLTTTLVETMLRGFAAFNAFYCAYDNLSAREKYRAFSSLVRAELDSNFSVVLLSLTLAASTTIEMIMDNAFDHIVEYLDKLQSEKGGNNPIGLKPEDINQIKQWIVSRSSGLMISARNHLDSKVAHEVNGKRENDSATSLEEFFQPDCLRVLSGAQLLLNAISGISERFDKYAYLHPVIDAVSQCPSLNKLLRNIMCACWVGDSTSFHNDTLTGLEMSIGKEAGKASHKAGRGGGLPKLLKTPIDYQSRPFASTILLSLGIDASHKDPISKDVAAALGVSCKEEEPTHYTCFSLLDGPTKLMMNHGLLCDIIRRISKSAEDKVLTPLSISVSRANPLQSAVEALQREGIFTDNSLHDIFKTLQAAQIAELPTQPDPTLSLLGEFFPTRGSARILNPQFLSHFSTPGRSKGGSMERDEGEGHGPRREFYDLLSNDMTSEFGPWCIGQGTLAGKEGKNSAVVTLPSTYREDDIRRRGYTKCMKVRWKLPSSTEYRVHEAVSYSLGARRDSVNLKLNEPMEENAEGIMYEISSKRDALFVRQDHADLFWFNESLQCTHTRVVEFIVVGWLLGASLFNRCKIPSKFSIVLYQLLLHDEFEPTLLDASNFDPELFDQCKTILNAGDEEFKSILELEDENVASLAQFAVGTHGNRRNKNPTHRSCWKRLFSCGASDNTVKSRVRPEETMPGAKLDASTLSYGKAGYVKKILQQRILGRHETGFWWMLSCMKLGFIKCLGVEVFEFLRRTLKFTPLQLFQAVHAPYYCPTALTALSLLRFDEILFENSNSTLSILKLFRVVYDAEARRSENKLLCDALWMCVEGMRPTEKKQFLKFVCGSDRVGVPFENQLSVVIPSLSFTRDDHLQCLRRLPTAHTCTNTLELPNYLNSLRYFHPHAGEERIFLQLKKTIRDKLMTAIEHGAQQYGLDSMEETNGAHEGEGDASDDDVLGRKRSTPDSRNERTEGHTKGTSNSTDIVRVKW